MEKPMYYAEIAENFYNSACPSHAINGYEKNVLMDIESEKCIFVSSDVQPSENEALFRCKRAHGNTVVTLKTPYKEKVKASDACASVQSKWKRYEGLIRNTIVEQDITERFVYLPEPLAYETIRTLKLSNMDDFLEKAAFNEKSDCCLNPYEILDKLHFEALFNSPYNYPYPVPEYSISNTLYDEKGNILTAKEDCLFHKFKFSHFERMEKGVCAVFSYEGVSEKVPAEPEEYEY